MMVSAKMLGWQGPGFYTRGSPDEPWVLRFEDILDSDDHNTIISKVKQDGSVWDMMVSREKSVLDQWLRSGCGVGYLEDTLDTYSSFEDLMECEVYETILYTMECNVPYGPSRNDPLACWWTDPSAMVEWETENMGVE